MVEIVLDGIVRFSANNGVMLDPEAIHASPEHLHKCVVLAFQHMNDEILKDACCGGRGPLAGCGTIDFEDYLAIKEADRLNQATQAAKRRHTAIRRNEFTASRSQLALAMIEQGVPYVCNHPECGVTTDLTLDHIIAISRGGSDDLSNLQFLCRRHNSQKGDKDAVG
jgi:5-methylcytosine-specific restriction endonuclease McrA